MARALLVLAGAAVALALVAPASAYVCLNGDPCLTGPCYAGQICTTVPASRGVIGQVGQCVAMCSNAAPQPPYVQPTPAPYGPGGCVACSTSDPCSVATCPGNSYCIADACRCTWTCAAAAPPRPPTPAPAPAPAPKPAPAPTPTPVPPQPAPLPNGGCPPNLPYTHCYSDPCAYTGVTCPRGSFCQASNCGACRALCVRPSLADPAMKEGASPAADDAFGPALVPPLVPAAEVEVAAAAKEELAAKPTKA